MKSEYISVKPYEKYEPMEDTSYNDTVLRNYIINAFAYEFEISTSSAIALIEKLDIYETLIDRYWDDIYKCITGGNDAK